MATHIQIKDRNGNTQILFPDKHLLVDVLKEESGALIINSFPALELNFDYTDVNDNTLVIGAIPPGRRVYSVLLKISTAFDSTSCTVGDDAGQGRFLVEQDSDLSLIESYQSFDTHLYTTETDISIYFVGTPTQGSGSIIVFYQ